MAIFQQRVPRSMMARQLAAQLMSSPATPASGAAGAFANLARPIAGALAARGAGRMEQREREVELDSIARGLREVAEARQGGGDPTQAAISAIGQSPGLAQMLGPGLAEQLMAGTEPETFGAPVAAIGPEGEPVFIRPGTRGTTQEVEGFRPPPKAGERPKPYTDIGKAKADYEAGFITAEQLAQAENPPMSDFTDAKKLRDEFVKQSGDFVKVRDAYNRIEASAQDPSAAGDLALIFNYMKVLDPGSTVREGEFATAQNSGGVPERARAAYNKVLRGERLAPTQRQDFVSRAGDLFNAQNRSHQQRVGEYERLAGRFNIAPEDVIVDMNRVQQRAEPTQAEAPAVEATQETVTAGVLSAAPTVGSSISIEQAGSLPEDTVITNPQTGMQMVIRNGRPVPLGAPGP